MKIITTRAKEDSQQLIEKFAELDFFSFPVIEFVNPSDDFQTIDVSIRNNQHYHWIFFLSKRAAESFFDRLHEIGGQFFHLHPGLKIACVGEKTADYIRDEVAFPVDFVPTSFNSDSFTTEFLEKHSFKDSPASISKTKVILVRAEGIEDDFIVNFENTNQFEIDLALAYKSQIAKPEQEQISELQDLLRSAEQSFLSFASSQSFRNFLELTKGIDFSMAQNTKILSIGPKTTKTINDTDFANNFEIIESETSSFDALFEKVLLK